MGREISEGSASFWQQSLDGLFAALGSGPSGLSGADALKRLSTYGPNVLQKPKRSRLVLQFLSKFKNPLVLVLLFSSAVLAFTGDITSFLIISAIVLVSVTLDFIQEHRASQAAESLRQSVAVRVQVIRDSRSADIPITDLVPGDIVSLSAGDLIPADGRVLEAKDFFVNQALLTGEPYPVEKYNRELPEQGEVLSAVNTVLMGTSVISGSAKVLVVRTGERTMLGEIADTLIAKPPPTAFEQGTRQFGLLIMRLTILLVLFVLFVNAVYHRPWLESFLFAVALAVGLTPELLPMVVSVTLARGAQRMAKRRVIVKRLASIQNLGSMDILCTDKTGTLTEARIRLAKHLDADGKDSSRVLELAYLNSYFETGLKSPLDEAILEHSEIDPSAWHKIDEVPFDFERRRVSVLVDNGRERLLVVKGAPEDILGLSRSFEVNGGAGSSPLDGPAMTSVRKLFEDLGREGFRVLGIAWRRTPSDHSHAIVTDETELVFAGFAAFLDPPKESARDALSRLEASNVEVKIVTGDNELVTQHICNSLGLRVKGVLTGSEVQSMDDQALSVQADRVNLFCRVTPSQKNRIILALKKRGSVVGYLGDGINDAPSLHSADVGISVDGAVDVAKEAAEMILLDHDLNVLRDGVIEGRRTFGNVMKYVMMGTSSNFGNMFSMAGGSLFLPFLPMLPVQILLNNMLYDFSEIPIPLDNVDEEYLVRPRKWDTSFIRNFMLAIGPVSSFFDFVTFFVMLRMFQAGDELFHTGWFMESMATQVLVIFIIRTSRNPLKSRPNPWLAAFSLAVVAAALSLPFTPLGRYLGFVPPPPLFFLVLCGITVLYLASVQWVKSLVLRRITRA